VHRLRHELEADGTIQPAAERIGRTPPPRRPGRARLAIGAAGPDATASQIASLAGVTYQAAWIALRQHRQAQQDAEAAAARARMAGAKRHPPRIRELAEQPPDLTGAACVSNRYLSPGAWTGNARRNDAQLALIICRTACPCLQACRSWALGPSATSVTGIVAGLPPKERRALRRQRNATARALPWPKRPEP
jgi:hypothetical protein